MLFLRYYCDIKLMGVIMKKLLILSIFGLFVAINGTMNAAAKMAVPPPLPALDAHAAIVEALADDGMNVKDARTLATATLAIAGAKVDESALLKFRTLCEGIGKDSVHADALLKKCRAAAFQTPGLAESTGSYIGGTAGWITDSTWSATKTATAWTVGTGWAITKRLGKGLWNIGKYGIAKPLEYTYYGAKKVLGNKKALIIIGTLALVISILEGLNRYDMLPSADARFWVGLDIDGQWDAVGGFASRQASHVHGAYQALPTQQAMLESLNAWCEALKGLPQAAWDRDTLWTNSMWEKVSGMYTEILKWVQAVSKPEFRDAPEVIRNQTQTINTLNTTLAETKATLTAKLDDAQNLMLKVCQKWQSLTMAIGNGNKEFIQTTCDKVLSDEANRQSLLAAAKKAAEELARATQAAAKAKAAAGL